MSLSLRTLPALALALVLSACGGGSVEPVTQKGFGPSQLYDPARNPTGRVLLEPEFRKTQVDAFSYVAVASTPAEYRDFLARDYQVQGERVRASGASLD